MGKLTLMGARKFIDMPVGTYYVPYWKNYKSECREIIKEFQSNPRKYLDADELHVYVDNSGSMSFLEEVADEDNIFYYDANVVGDASPTTTLYVVFEKDMLPNEMSFDCGRLKLSKDFVLKATEKFLKEVEEDGGADRSSKHFQWAKDTLDEYASEEGNIVDTYICVEV